MIFLSVDQNQWCVRRPASQSVDYDFPVHKTKCRSVTLFVDNRKGSFNAVRGPWIKKWSDLVRRQLRIYVLKYSSRVKDKTAFPWQGKQTADAMAKQFWAKNNSARALGCGSWPRAYNNNFTSGFITTKLTYNLHTINKKIYIIMELETYYIQHLYGVSNLTMFSLCRHSMDINWNAGQHCSPDHLHWNNDEVDALRQP